MWLNSFCLPLIDAPGAVTEASCLHWFINVLISLSSFLPKSWRYNYILLIFWANLCQNNKSFCFLLVLSLPSLLQSFAGFESEEFYELAPSLVFLLLRHWNYTSSLLIILKGIFAPVWMLHPQIKRLLKCNIWNITNTAQSCWQKQVPFVFRPTEPTCVC